MKRIQKLIREFVAFAFRFSGIPFLIRRVLLKKHATIIFYHDPEPEVFKKHMEYLSKHHHFISLGKLVSAIQSRDWSGIPPGSLVVTFDDGHKGNHHLLPIFEEFKMCPTIYLCSHITDTKRRFWFKVEGENLDRFKKYTNKERLRVLKSEADYEPEKEYPSRQALNLEEIKEMSAFVDFQSHAKFHPVLTTCSDEECLDEIKDSKERLQKLLSKEIVHFSYPNGDYGEREIACVKESGYASARTLDVGFNGIASDLYRLKSMGVEDFASINVLCAQVSGFFGYLRYFRHGSFNGKHPRYL